MIRILTLALCVGLTYCSVAAAAEPESLAAIRKSLTLSASFDASSDADFAKGDKQLYLASSAQRKDAQPGLPAGEIELAKGQGRHGGGALRFIKKSDKVIFYKAAGNVAYRTENWSGTVSFWLSLDPNKDLGNWYCDPIQITEKAWDNGALWVDFSRDEKPKHFRLGAFADTAVWNPTKRDFDSIPPAERPMYTVTQPPFQTGKWTHIAFTFENFNTGKPNGTAKLYLDGKPQGTVSARNQQFTWTPDKAAIQLGMSYVGLYDDLSLFDRALTDSEIETLFKFEGRLSEAK
jgi:hypothetical protein